MRVFLSAALAFAGLASMGAQAADKAAPAAGALVFLVDHVRDDSGHVRIDVCTEATFLKSGCPYSGAAPAVKGVTRVVVDGVPPGVYAAQVYHDRNDDHTVNRRLGIPVEEIGFSNNAPIGLRGPRFAKAAFVHDATEQDLAVKLRRYE